MRKFSEIVADPVGFINEAKNGEAVKVKVGKDWVDATITDGEPYKGKIEVQLSDGKKIDVKLDKEVKFKSEF